MEFISDSIASHQLAASVAFIASRYVIGSSASVKTSQESISQVAATVVPIDKDLLG
jgi:hypothetical protein